MLHLPMVSLNIFEQAAMEVRIGCLWLGKGRKSFRSFIRNPKHMQMKLWQVRNLSIHAQARRRPFVRYVLSAIH